MKSKVLVCIVNHNMNNEAKILRDKFSQDFDTIVLDSGSNEKEDSFILLDNVYYSGLFNVAVEYTEKMKKTWLFFICSDVTIEDDEYWKLCRRIENEKDFSGIGVYSPSSFGRSHHFCKNKGTKKFRDVPMIEGFVFMARIDILRKMYPVNLTTNYLGWGLDAMKGYLCHSSGLRCVIDDLISVYHPTESGYNGSEAMDQMKKYIESKGIDFKNYVRREVGFKI
jgi:hypothetical protein